jgi:hypothetical protein
VADFLSGKSLGTGTAAAALVLPEDGVAKAAYIPGGAQEVLITMPDGTTARAVLQTSETMAALE